MSKTVTEAELLKSLDELEGAVLNKGCDGESSSSAEDVEKGDIPEQWNGQDAVNGGFSSEGGEGEEDFKVVKPEHNEPKKGAVAKSLEANEQVREGLELSSFLKGFAGVMSDAIETQTAAMIKSFADVKGAQEKQEEFNARVQKAIVAMGNILVEIQKSLGIVAEQPVSAPRSVVSKSEVVERGFNRAGGEEAVSFSKGQTLEALTDLVVKGQVDSVCVSEYEASGSMDPNLVPLVNKRLTEMFGTNR